MKQINPPTHCPSCSATLLLKNDQLFCTNDDCEAKSSKAIAHFAKTAKIKGLGAVSIEKLVITSIEDIYQLTERECSDILGKNGVKVFAEIENSKVLPLELLLPAFSIPLFGKTASLKLCETITDLNAVSTSVLKQAGLGEKTSASFMKWYNEVYLVKYKGVLPFSFKSDITDKKPSIQKGIVCISGKLKSFKTKALAALALGEKGYEVKSSLTKDVTHLINESGVESTKTTKARQSGTVIITDLIQFLGE